MMIRDHAQTAVIALRAPARPGIPERGAAAHSHE